MEKLKPCPFCGGEAGYYPNPSDGVTVKCNSCKASTSYFKISLDYGAKEKATEAWNRRVDDGTD